jgi:hypothetical protein
VDSPASTATASKDDCNSILDPTLVVTHRLPGLPSP